MPKKEPKISANENVLKLWYPRFLKSIGYDSNLPRQEAKALLGSFRIVKKTYDPDEETTLTNVNSKLAFAPCAMESWEKTQALNELNFDEPRDYAVSLDEPDTEPVDEYTGAKSRRMLSSVRKDLALQGLIREAEKKENLPFYDSKYKDLVEKGAAEYAKARSTEKEENIKDRFAIINADMERNVRLYDEIKAFELTYSEDQMYMIARLFDAAQSGELYRISEDGYSRKYPYHFNFINGGFVDQIPAKEESRDVLPDEQVSEHLYFAHLASDPYAQNNGRVNEVLYTEAQKKLLPAEDPAYEAVAGNVALGIGINRLKQQASEVEQIGNPEPVPEVKQPVSEEKQQEAETEEKVQTGISEEHRKTVESSVAEKLSSIFPGVKADSLPEDYSEIKEALTEQYTDLAVLVEKYNLGEKTFTLLRSYGIDALPLKDIAEHGLDGEAAMTEEQFREYLLGENGILNAKVNSNDETVLNELGMSKGDLMNMAVRNRTTISQSLSSMHKEMGDAEESLEEKYDLRTMRTRLALSSDNPLDDVISEEFAKIRANLVDIGGLQELRKSYAKIVSAMAQKETLRGADLVNDGEARFKADRMAKDDKPWTDLLKSEKFIAYFEKNGLDALRRIAYAEGPETLREIYSDFKTGIKDKKLDDISVRVERYNNVHFLGDRASYFTGKEISSSGEWRKTPANPFGFHVDRSSLNMIAFSELLDMDCPVEGALDPYRYNEAKIVCGQKAWADIENGTPEGAEKLRGLMINGLDKCIKYADEIMGGIRKFDLQTVTSGKLRGLIDVGNYMQDYIQEYKFVKDGQDEIQQTRMDVLMKKTAGYLTFTNSLKPLMRGLGKLQKGQMDALEAERFITTDLTAFSTLSKTFEAVRSLPGAKNVPMSQLLTENEVLLANTKGPNAIIQNQLRNDRKGNPENIKKYFGDPKIQKHWAKEFMNGKLGKTLDVSVKVNKQTGMLDYKVSGGQKFYENVQKTVAKAEAKTK